MLLLFGTLLCCFGGSVSLEFQTLRVSNILVDCLIAQTGEFLLTFQKENFYRCLGMNMQI